MHLEPPHFQDRIRRLSLGVPLLVKKSSNPARAQQGNTALRQSILWGNQRTLDRDWSERLVSIIETAPADVPLRGDAGDATIGPHLLRPYCLLSVYLPIATRSTKSSDARSRALKDHLRLEGLSLEGDALRAWWESGDAPAAEAALGCLSRGGRLRAASLHLMRCIQCT